ncbi:MAG: glycosyltransferase, partial [Lachnospiraceae bacterium]|nr:glycosyltransferase [Lachnospiraceae bacterium]
VLRQVYDLARNVGMKEVFERAFRDMTSGDRFQKINEYTAPILVFYGDEDVCSGVLRQFSEEITKALVKKGVAVHAGIAGQLDYDDMEKTIYKAVLGFQAAAFKNVFFQSLSGKKLQFWLDNPVFNQDMIKAMPKDCTFLCQDGNYADFIRKYYGYEAVVLPPGGCGSEWETLQERPYDISFLGAYQLPFAGVFRHEEKEYYDHMITHSGETFFFGMCEMQKENGTYVSDEESADRVRKMKHVCQYVINYYRDKVIRSIVEHGYKLHVYGNSWDAFPMQEMLVRHPEVKGGEALVEFSKAKIGLNVMSWHKNGLTERVLNIMRSGSVCLTDYSEAVAKNFNDGTDLVIFRLDETQRLPELIRELLQNDAWKMIGENGRAKAQKRHSWEVRAEEVLRILGETKKNKKI